LARALVYEPDILLLDEPLASLDNMSKENLLHHIAALRKRLSFSCLYVTHDEREAFRLGDRIGILGGGTLQQIGSPSSLLTAPSTAEIARLLGAWNLLTVGYEPNAHSVILPKGSIPRFLPVTGTPPNVTPLYVGFTLSSATLHPPGHTPLTDCITLVGTVSDVYLQHQALIVVIDINNSTIRVQCSPRHPVPQVGQSVICSIPLADLKQFTR
jgi:ABC-type sugar transport system ATPase subunit